MNNFLIIYLSVITVTCLGILLSHYDGSDGTPTAIHNNVYRETRRARVSGQYNVRPTRGYSFELNHEDFEEDHVVERAPEEVIAHLEDSIGGLYSSEQGLWRHNGKFNIRPYESLAGNDVKEFLLKIGLLTMVPVQEKMGEGKDRYDSTLFDMLILHEQYSIKDNLEFMMIYGPVYTQKDPLYKEDIDHWVEHHPCKMETVGNVTTFFCEFNLVFYSSSCYGCANSIAVATCTNAQSLRIGSNESDTGSIDFIHCQETVKFIGIRISEGESSNLLFNIIVLSISGIIFIFLAKSFIMPENLTLRILKFGSVTMEINASSKCREILIELLCMFLPWVIIGIGYGLFTPNEIHGVTHANKMDKFRRLFLNMFAGSIHINMWSCFIARIFQSIFGNNIRLRNAYNADRSFLPLLIGLISSGISTVITVLVINAESDFYPYFEIAVSLGIGVVLDLIIRLQLLTLEFLIPPKNSIQRVANELSGPSLCRASQGPYYTARDRFSIIPNGNGNLIMTKWAQVALSQQNFMFWLKTAVGAGDIITIDVERVKRGSNSNMILNSCGYLVVRKGIPCLLYQDSEEVGLPSSYDLYIA